MIYFDVVYDALSKVPNSLKHRITASFQDANQAPQTYTVIGHTGAISGYSSFVGYLPDQDATIVVLTNLQNAWDLTKEEKKSRLL